MRKVKFTKFDNGKESGFLFGTFHQWAAECTETNDGFGNYTVAIIEQVDGTVTTTTPDRVIFLNDDPCSTCKHKDESQYHALCKGFVIDGLPECKNFEQTN